MLIPQNIRTVDDAKRIVNERNMTHVKIGLFDIDGIMRGKYLRKEKFFAALDQGLAFCDVILGWDSDDQLYEGVGVKYTGWHTGYPDAPVRVVPSTCRDIPFEPGMLLFICEFAGDAAAICPRNLLHRTLEQAKAMGFSVHAAFEYEFFLFNETPDSIRQKHYRDLQPITPGFFGYSILRNSVHAELYQELLALGEAMDFPIEGLHTETGPGVIEAALGVDGAASAADKAALFKTFTKVWAQRKGLMATFMAKWSNDYPGQSGHIHLSLRHQDNDRSAFYDASQPLTMSTTQRHFIGGQQRYMPELLALVASTVNAYTRLVPGFWAPTDATWGCQNRTTALRLIPGSDSSQRVEYRVGPADANPYLALSAALASGLKGIAEGIEPEPMIEGNAYEQTHPSHLALPQSLAEASAVLKHSHTARTLFGDAFVDHYAASRQWEASAHRQHVSDWELQRYFEII